MRTIPRFLLLALSWAPSVLPKANTNVQLCRCQASWEKLYGGQGNSHRRLSALYPGVNYKNVEKNGKYYVIDNLLVLPDHDPKCSKSNNGGGKITHNGSLFFRGVRIGHRNLKQSESSGTEADVTSREGTRFSAATEVDDSREDEEAQRLLGSSDSLKVFPCPSNINPSPGTSPTRAPNVGPTPTSQPTAAVSAISNEPTIASSLTTDVPTIASSPTTSEPTMAPTAGNSGGVLPTVSSQMPTASTSAPTAGDDVFNNPTIEPTITSAPTTLSAGPTPGGTTEPTSSPAPTQGGATLAPTASPAPTPGGGTVEPTLSPAPTTSNSLQPTSGTTSEPTITPAPSSSTPEPTSTTDQPSTLTKTSTIITMKSVQVLSRDSDSEPRTFMDAFDLADHGEGDGN